MSILRKHYSLHIIAALLPLLLAACNSDVDTTEQQVTNNSVAIKSFQLRANKKVLANLDSVYFAIDLAGARIFNADSLPPGTDVSRLQFKLGLQSVGNVTVTYSRGAAGDTLVTYKDDMNDSIDFSHGPAIVTVTSRDGTLSRDYRVFVNVHRTQPDSLHWSLAEHRQLPTTLQEVTAQRTVEYGGSALCLTTDGTRYCLATAIHPAGEWSMQEVTLPVGARISTFTAGKQMLLILDDSGMLHTSADGTSWLPSGEQYEALLGRYGDDVLALRREEDGTLVSDTYPTGRRTQLPEGFPVTGFSDLITYTSRWSTHPVALFVGGTDADGDAAGEAWAYDGTQWATLSVDPSRHLPALTDITLVPYFAYRTDDYWHVTRETVLMAMCGRTADGTPSDAIYLSFDRGIHWEVAPALMAMPEYIAPRYGASGLVFSTWSGEAARGWQQIPLRDLPHYLVPEPMTRVVRPVTEWEVPEIFLFGGNTEAGLDPSVWRGVITRLTYRPLY